MNSATKSVIGALIAIATKEGLLDSLDRRVTDFFTDRTIANLDDNKKAITIQNLLDMTSGLDWTEPLDGGAPQSMLAMERSPDWVQFVLDRPMTTAAGAAFNYDSGNPQLLSAILTKLTGQSASDYARRRLFEPLGISDVFWRSDPQGVSVGGYGLFLQPRDMAKFGYLFLHNGVWDGHQIIPPSWIDRIRHASVPMNVRTLRYANLFWVDPNNDVYLANGYHGQRIFVMPKLDVVAVATGTGHSASMGNEIEMIAGSVKSDAPLRPDAVAQSLLTSRIEDAASEKRSPVFVEQPDIAKTISGKVYRFPNNPLRLSTVSLRLDGQSPSYAYELKSARPDGPAQRFEGPIGLDGVYRTSAPTSLGITAAKGAWSYDKSFVAQLQELGADDLRTVILSFKDKAVDLIFKPREGPAVELRGEASD
jgi:hypothetical protein